MKSLRYDIRVTGGGASVILQLMADPSSTSHRFLHTIYVLNSKNVALDHFSLWLSRKTYVTIFPPPHGHTCMFPSLAGN